MQDLLKIIKLKGEIDEIDYIVSNLKSAELDFANNEEYEKANVMLKEQLRLRAKKKLLTKRLEKV
jgi:hypothetical protein|tara:strand:+ start:104 stop:298 length:195 start_codon:yes stop_codon:yes gene_type:complete